LIIWPLFCYFLKLFSMLIANLIFDTGAKFFAKLASLGEQQFHQPWTSPVLQAASLTKPKKLAGQRRVREFFGIWNFVPALRRSKRLRYVVGENGFSRFQLFFRLCAVRKGRRRKTSTSSAFVNFDFKLDKDFNVTLMSRD